MFETCSDDIAARPRPLATVRDLEIALLEEWNSIPQSLIDNLIASMANRPLHLSVDLSRERNDMSSFKKYKCLTISEKKKVIESVEEGERKVDVAKAFEIPLSSLTILKNKEKFFSASSSRV
ncbi:hypothetical protein TNCV_4559391 [Trichonephila clavipes]|nr:hypothetical protein TNCV_4559391 [Trichonephila clavipes]